MIQRVAVLGDGVTGKAVRDACERLGIDVVNIDQAELIVASPGIPPSEYPRTTLEIISEIEFAYRLAHLRLEVPRIIGVTGTNGKSTVTSLISHILDIPACGNIGLPFISLVGNIHRMVVIELSSYQLDRCFEFHPDISIFLNLTPDHLARHETMEEYMRTKARLIQNCRERDLIIYDGTSPYISQAIVDCPAQKKDLVELSDNITITNKTLVADTINITALLLFWQLNMLVSIQKKLLKK